MAQCRYYLETVGPHVGIICVLGSLGFSVHGIISDVPLQTP